MKITVSQWYWLLKQHGITKDVPNMTADILPAIYKKRLRLELLAPVNECPDVTKNSLTGSGKEEDKPMKSDIKRPEGFSIYLREQSAQGKRIKERLCAIEAILDDSMDYLVDFILVERPKDSRDQNQGTAESATFASNEGAHDQNEPYAVGNE